MQIALQVTKGTLRVTSDLAGAQHLLVTPSEPATLRHADADDARTIGRSQLMYEPVNGAVEGLTGTVKYSTP